MRKYFFSDAVEQIQLRSYVIRVIDNNVRVPNLDVNYAAARSAKSIS